MLYKLKTVFTELSMWSRVLIALYGLTFCFVFLSFTNILFFKSDKYVKPEVSRSENLPTEEFHRNNAGNHKGGVSVARSEIPTYQTEPTEKLITDKSYSWQNYAQDWVDTGKPKLAIIIDDMGMVMQALKRVEKINMPLTLAFLPYADDLDYQTSLAYEAGHELMVHMPMEPKSRHADPGQHALLKGYNQKEMAQEIRWNLMRFSKYVAVNNHMGSLLTEDAESMNIVMSEVKEQGVFFLDSLTSNQSKAIESAKTHDLDYLSRDIFLDNKRDKRAILQQFEKAISIAHKRGFAIAIGHPYSETLDILEQWKSIANFDSVDVVPISQIMYYSKENLYKKYAQNQALSNAEMNSR